MAEKKLIDGQYGAAIRSVGYYVPPREVSNFDLEKLVETSDEWITTRTGISKRRFVEDHQTTVDISVLAAQDALQKAEMDPMELDLIVLGTSSPEMIIPATSCGIQRPRRRPATRNAIRPMRLPAAAPRNIDQNPILTASQPAMRARGIVTIAAIM